MLGLLCMYVCAENSTHGNAATHFAKGDNKLLDLNVNK